MVPRRLCGYEGMVEEGYSWGVRFFAAKGDDGQLDSTDYDLAPPRGFGS